MAELWELVLHHSYAGTPGVVFDQSPGRGGHGVAVNIADTDFLRDGAAERSGAVRIRPNSRIDVPGAQAWRPLSGIRIEVVCICDEATGGSLVVGHNFGFGVHNGDMSSSHGFANGGGGGFRTGQSGDVVPIGEWITVAWTYDGALHADFSLNGTVVKQFTNLNAPWPEVGRVTIGCRMGPDGPSGHFTGRIDDVKVWRLNPHRINDEFTGRPMDESVRNCWAEWFRKLHDLSRNDAECADSFATLLNEALRSSVADLITSGAATRPEFIEAMRRYRYLWAEGRLDEMPAVLADLMALLRQLGVDPNNNAAVQALRNDDCVRRIVDALPIDCDSKFTNMINGVLLP